MESETFNIKTDHESQVFARLASHQSDVLARRWDEAKLANITTITLAWI